MSLNCKKTGAGPGIHEATEVLAALGNPQKRIKAVHVAGTNGKGSVCAMLESVLRAAGYKTGLFTSPHLVRISERIKISGAPIGEEELESLRAFEKISGLPFFSQLAVAAFTHFAEQKTDVAVIETGIGGRLDATNVLETPELSVIASIGFDHTELLGDTLEQIAYEKAGIIKKGRPVAVGVNANRSVIFETARRLGAETYRTDEGLSVDCKSFDYNGMNFSAKNNFFEYKNLRLSLAGLYQLENASLVLTSVEALRRSGFDITDDAVRKGLETVSWPGRFQIFDGTPAIVLDGAHNADGAEAFRKSLESYFPDKKRVVTVGALRRKDCKKILNRIAAAADIVICTEPPHQDALGALELSHMTEGFGGSVIVCPDYVEALERARAEAGPDGVAAAAGSLYLIGGLYDRLQGGNKQV